MNCSNEKALLAQREYQREWRKKHRERVREYNTRYWARRFEREGSVIGAGVNQEKEGQ